MIKQTPKETPAPTPRTLVGETNLAAGVVLLLPADAEKLLSHRFFADLDAASGEITRIENRRFVKSNHLIPKLSDSYL